MPDFRLPGAADRIVVMGATGTGKTIAGAWVLSKQNFRKRPWVAIDFKDEIFWDEVGDPPMRPLKLGQLPGKQGLYRMKVYPGQEEQLEDWLWKVWRKENIGLFCDEVSLIPQRDAFKAILRQGRSKHIPVIACTQRPVDCDREVFTESQYMAIFRMNDVRDYKTIEGLIRGKDVRPALPAHNFYWYDAGRDLLFTLKPVPHPDTLAADFKAKLPRTFWLGN